jgi:hypothetical protein
MIVSMFMAWHVTAGAVAPLAMYLLESSRANSPSGASKLSTPEVCEHHAMPGAICPMHSRPSAGSSNGPACAIVACDAAASNPFWLLALNGPSEPPVEIDAQLVIAERSVAPDVPLPDLSPSPATPPPRA